METTRRSRGPKQYVRILLGVVAAVFAIRSFVETRAFVQHATRVQGVVRSVDRTDSIDGEGNVSAVPDIVFETSSGGEAMLRGDGNYVCASSTTTRSANTWTFSTTNVPRRTSASRRASGCGP
jgi:hypothetical protein